MQKTELFERLKIQYPNATIEVTDLTGGGDHYEVSIVSDAFKGLSRIDQHKAVMQVFAEELQTGELHALSLKTKSQS